MKRAAPIVGTVLLTFACIIYFLHIRSKATEAQAAICAPSPKVPVMVAAQLAERNIYEAIFRYRIEQIGERGVFFLSINGNDPNDAFMARFSDSRTTIRKNSDAYASKQFSPWIFDKSTGTHGVRLFVGNVTWVSAVLAEVKGGSQCGSLCADGGIYRVANEHGRWVVIHYEIQLVS